MTEASRPPIHSAPIDSVFATEPMVRQPRDGHLAMSFAQERFWMLHEMDPDNAAYDLLLVYMLRGELDRDALEWSLDQIVRCHDALRTTLALVDGEPVQMVADADASGSPILSRVELPSPDDARQAAVDFALRDSTRGFDLEKGPLCRFVLLQLGAAEHALVVHMHHAVSDAHSMYVFELQLAGLYELRRDGRPLPTGELPLQYPDYARWQRRCYDHERDRLLGYWKRQLGGAPVLELPTDRPRPAVQGPAGARHDFVIEEEIVDGLRALCRQERCTLFMALLAAFQVLLSRLAEEDDIVVGTAVANRSRAEIDPLIGSFASSVVLRTDLSGSPTFRQLLHRVRGVALDAMEHAEMPFEQLVAELQPRRDPSRNPWYQVLFNVLHYPRPIPMRGLEVEKIDPDRGTAMLDLALVVTEPDLKPDADERRARGHFEYSTDLFDAATIGRWERLWRRTMERVIAEPDAPIDDLDLLTDEQRRRLLADADCTQSEYLRDRCLHELFEDVVARAPDAKAVTSDASALTYGQLNARANRVAHYLRSLGAGPGAIVGVSLPRSPDVVVALLGILKAGAAYVPLDASYPARRLEYLLADAGVELLITRADHVPALPSGRPTMVRLDADASILESFSADDPSSSTRPDDPAYVIYTSGSTGVPKGVVGTHRATVNRCCWMWEEYAFEPEEVCCHKTSLSFVDSVWEIFGPLLAGVPSVVIGDDDVAEPRQLVRVLAEHGVTRIVLVPSLLEAVLDEAPRDQLPALRLWTSSGEELSAELARRFVGAMPAAVLLNLYGFSEAAADVTCYDTRQGIPPSGGVPIGRPIANTRVYLLDRHGNPVPPGVVGEICVGGDGLARGYLRRPAMTAEKFVPDGLSGRVGARLYRSGDFGCWDADGNLEYRGRRDHQVVVRGFRIELGEVEAALAAHPRADRAVVTVDTKAASPRLIAHVVPVELGEGGELVRELRMFAREELPDYMVPSAIAILDELPLTPSGKVDRVALVEAGAAPFATAVGYVPPRTPTERRVAEVWREVLDADRVGIHDNFFDLGGHSLLAMKAVVEIEKRTGERVLPMEMLLQSLQQLAEMCDRRARARAAAQSVPPHGHGALGRLRQWWSRRGAR